MNWIDFIIIGIVLLEAYLGWRRGFLRSILGLATWLGSLLLALLFYSPVAGWLKSLTGLSEVWARPLAFLLVAFAGLLALIWLSGFVMRRIPVRFHRQLGNRLLGILPGTVSGLVTATIVSLMLLTLPLPGLISRPVQESRLANYLSVRTEGVQVVLDRIFGEAVSRALTITTVQPGSEERIDLPFTVTDAAVRPDLEREMIALVNAEREKAGLRPLEEDPALREVARRYSTDMFARGYFSHVNPEGLSPFDRLRAADIGFLIAGENIALAPTLATAHSGLMNSPGHRANILRSQFGRVGIGIMDGGPRGIMVTQLFRN